jgi:hypothetical protein
MCTIHLLVLPYVVQDVVSTLSEEARLQVHKGAHLYERSFLQSDIRKPLLMPFH